QKPLKYLAGAAFWQFGLRKLDAARNFEIGERPSAIRDQLISSKSSPRPENNAGFHDLTPLRVRYSEDCDFAHGWMRVNHGFDFAGINVLSAGNDHVLQTIENVEVSICVLIADIAGAKEAVPECTLRLLRVVPIATHDIRAARD